MKPFLYTFFLLFIGNVTAQVPESPMLSMKVFGGDGGDKVIPYVTHSPDGGFILCLSTTSLTGQITDTFCAAVPSFGKAIFVKYNSDATILEWFKCRQNSWSDTGYLFMFQTLDDKYILGGVASSGNSWLIRKEDAMGNVLWIKAYGGSGSQMLYGMIQTDDGGYVLFGSTYSEDGDIGFHYGSAGTRDFWVLKVNANGDKVWSKVYGGTSEEIGASIVAAPNSGFYIIGSTGSVDYDCTGNKGDADAYVARLNKDGEILWHRCLGGTGSDGGGEVEGCRAVEDGKGGVLIASRTGSSDGDVSHKINDIGNNIWLVNVDSASNIIWDNCYGGSGKEYPNSLCRGTDGSIWILGCSRLAGGQVNIGYGGSSDAWIVHTNTVGSLINAKVLGSNGQDVGYMVHPLSDGSVLAGGYYGASDGVFPSVFYGGFPDAFLVKFANWSNEIKIVASDVSVSVFPNPASEQVKVICSRPEYTDIHIIDVLGKQVYGGNFISGIQLPIADWHKGVYYIQLTGANGYERMVQKLVVK